MTISQYTHKAIKQLAPLYDESEAKWIVRTMMESITGMSRTDILLHGSREMEPETETRYERIIARLLKHEPIQYILGETYWHGMTLKVNPTVLIPREETSELVDIIVKDNKNRVDLDVIDICTGSGCIAIALARYLPFASVSGIDISADALTIARENASLCKTKVYFKQEDALKPISSSDQGKYDIVVSNPPYIAQHEMKKMDRNVLDYEPHLALFVPDDDPLKFYRPISRNAMTTVRPRGKLYLEINPLFSDQLVAMLTGDGWDNVMVVNDMHGKERFATAIKPE